MNNKEVKDREERALKNENLVHVKNKETELNLENIEDCHNLLLLLATNCHNIMQQSAHATSNFDKVEKAQEICRKVQELLTK